MHRQVDSLSQSVFDEIVSNKVMKVNLCFNQMIDAVALLLVHFLPVISHYIEQL